MVDTDRRGQKWSREETILAYDLYCRTPFSKIGKSNKDIIKLANLIGRTPSSVSLKMDNLAHFDPAQIARGIVGMSNASKLDEEITKEFLNDWEGLSYQAQNILAKYMNTSIAQLVDLSDVADLPFGEYKERLMKQRIGQNFFRTSVLNAYGHRCCITGMENDDLLIASHIKPWKVSDAKTERTNPGNGLCLNALHDRAFDKGLITIDYQYRVINSTKLNDTMMDEQTMNWIKSYNHKHIILPNRFAPAKEFIEYHNDMVFLG